MAQALDVLPEHPVAGKKADLLSGGLFGNFGDEDEDRYCKDHRPHGTRDGDGSNGDSVVVAEAEDVELEEPKKSNEQHQDSAEVTKTPPQATDATNIFRGRNLDNHGVVVDVCYLGEDVSCCHQGDAKNKHVRFDGDKKQARLDEHHENRVDREPPFSVACPVRSLAENRGQGGDEETSGGNGIPQVARERGRSRLIFGGVGSKSKNSRIDEGVADQIHGENESGDDGGEGLCCPIPQRPAK